MSDFEHGRKNSVRRGLPFAEGDNRRYAAGSCRSNADVFASRGDPWVSPREGLQDYGRTVWSENPDLDRYTLAKQARVHNPDDVTKAVPRDNSKTDEHRKLCNIARALNIKLRGKI